MTAVEGDEITPLPMDQMMVAFMIQITEALNITVLFPYIAFMVEDYGAPYNSEKNLGRYVGLLAACFCGAQFFTSSMWAMAADKYGRKPTLFVGTLGVAFGVFVFGTATTYSQAIAGRIISGLLCGNLGILKTFLTEITDSSNRGGGFSVLSISWSIGTVFSPLIGGMLSKPCVLYPEVFKEGTWLWRTFTYFPYLLPALVVMSVNLVTSVLILVYLVETNPNMVNGSNPVVSASGVASTQQEYSMVDLHSTHGYTNGIEGEEEGVEEGGDELKQGSEDQGLAIEMIDVSLGAIEAGGKNVDVEFTNDAEEPAVPIMWRRNVQLAVGSYGMLALGQIVFDETLPLYMKLDKPRGFSYETHEIGIVLSVAGAIFTCFTLTLLPIMANYNKSRLYFWGCLTTVPVAFCMPLLPRLASHDDMTVWLLLLASLLWKNVSLTLAFTAVCCQISESVSASEVASVNGLAQSMAALSRAFGPACGGLLWSAFLLADHVEGNFIIVCVVMLMCIAMNHQLPDQLLAQK
jgi:MFS family permease